MFYSDLYLQQQSRPSKVLVALAMIAVISFAIFYYTSEGTPTRASKQTVKQHEAVNVTARQAGVFWETETADQGWILYGSEVDKTDKIALDPRDSTNEKSNRLFHYAVIKDLQPETTYYYKIISNNEIIQSPNGDAFSFKTAPETGSSGLLTPAYGKVALSNGSFASQAIVLMNIPEAYPLLAITGNSGEWLIPLQYIVGKRTNVYVVASETTLAKIKIFNDSQSSIINTVLGQTHPLPKTVVLGENYNFDESSSVLSAQSKRTAESGTTHSTVSIRFPKNGSVIPGNAPLIKGYGVPGKSVQVEIDSKPLFTETVTVDKNGDWNVLLSRTFLPGRYTLTILTQNSQGKTVELQSTYTLIKSGERVLGESTSATPSATLIPTRTVSTTVAPSPTPTIGDSNDPITDEPTATPAPPVSGLNVTIPFLVTGAGFVIAGIGILLLL